jgi:ribosomal protein S3
MFFKSNLLSAYVAKIIYRSTNHFRSLKQFVENLNVFFNKNRIPIIGSQLRVTGKVGGKMRKTKYQYKLGKTQNQTLSNIVSYSKSLSFTKYGVISIKV